MERVQDEELVTWGVLEGGACRGEKYCCKSVVNACTSRTMRRRPILGKGETADRFGLMNISTFWSSEGKPLGFQKS